jgi:diguanylate cyclase (GGDEF)-like protein
LGIRLKLLLTFVVCFGLMAGISLPLLEHSMTTSYDAIERRDLTAHMARAVQSLEASLGNLQLQNRDWAVWTEMYDFAQRADAKWAGENLGMHAMDSADLSLVVVYGAQGQTLWTLTRARSGGRLALPTLQASPYAALLKTQTTDGRCGLLSTDAGLMLTCWINITRNDHSGDFVGTLVMGRLLDTVVQLRLREQVRLPMEFQLGRALPPGLMPWPATLAPGALKVSDFYSDLEARTAHLYCRLQDLLGHDAALVALDVPRDVHEQGERLYAQARQQLVLSALAIAGLLAIFVHLLLVRRLRIFASQLVKLAEESDWQRRIRIRGHDELGLVASKVNVLLALIESQVQSLQSLSLTDALTGLANRRAFDARLALEHAREHRNERPLALLLVDVDYFKRYNDQYGHPAGDAALRAVADILRLSVSRITDLAARIGGEEFAILLPETDLGGAKALAERVRSNLQERALVHAGSSVSPCLTVSMGIAMAGSDTLAEFLSRADQALYRAKAEGRNRVCCDEAQAAPAPARVAG